MQITNNSALQVLITASDETHPVLQKAKEDLLSYYNAIFSPIQNPQESILVRFAVQSDSELRFDGFAVDVKSSEIIITSPMERGILYGVYAAASTAVHAPKGNAHCERHTGGTVSAARIL